MSIVPVAIVAGVAYHLARQGVATQTVWLGLNALDSARALKTTRVNGRAIGVRTRRSALRQALIGWVVYVAIQQVGAIPDRLLAWLPLYSVLRAVVVTAFLLTRASMSETLYTSFIQPTVKRYEARIDLTLLLLHSISSLLFHFAIQYPLDHVHNAVRPLIRRISSLFASTTADAPPEFVVDPASEVADMTFGTIDDDAHIVSIADLQPIPESAADFGNDPRKVVRDTTARRSAITTESPLINASRPKSENMLSTRPGPARRLAIPPAFIESDSITARRRDDRVKRSTAPTPDSSRVSAKLNVFHDRTREPSSASTLKRKAPASFDALPDRSPPAKPAPLRATIAPKSMTNPLSQPPRRLYIARDANVQPAATKPLHKSKSTVELGPKKPLLVDARPVKSAPTRGTTTLANSVSTTGLSATTSRRVPSAADRARVLRDVKQKGEAVGTGEKRKSVRSIGPEGSKRTRVHVPHVPKD